MVLGVSASLLLEVRSYVQKGVTTKEFCESFIKPKTDASKCFLDLYSDKRDSEGKKYVAEATLFVSHAWRYELLDSINVMLDYSSSYDSTSEPMYFWFDVFVVNQHAAVNRTQDWWSSSFRAVIESISHVLLILSPWDNPVPMTRAWCLWEILCAVESIERVKFEIRLPKKQRIEFIRSFQEESVLNDPAIRVLGEIQAQKAEAYLETDRNMIFEAIQKSVGFEQVNQQVKLHLREWYIRTTREILDDTDADGRVWCLFHVGRLLKKFGLLQEPLEHFQEAYEMLIEQKGPNDLATLVVLGCIAGIHESQGDYDLAFKLFQQILNGLELTVGKNHEMTANTYCCMGDIFRSKDQYHMALEYLEIANQIFDNLPSTDSKIDKLVFMYTAFGHVYRKESKFELSKEYYEKALHLASGLYGKNYERMGKLYSNLGLLCLDIHSFDESLQHFENARLILEETFGKDHVDIAQVHGNIAIVLDNKGQLTESIEYKKKALKIFQQVGNNQEFLAMAHNDIGSSYTSTGQYDKAEYHLLEALAVSQKINQASGLSSSIHLNLGNFHSVQRNYGDALAHYYTTLEINRCICAESEAVASTLENISFVLVKQGKYEDALQVCSQTRRVRSIVFGDDHELTRRVEALKSGIQTKIDRGFVRDITFFEELLRSKHAIQDAPPLDEVLLAGILVKAGGLTQIWPQRRICILLADSLLWAKLGENQIRNRLNFEDVVKMTVSDGQDMFTLWTKKKTYNFHPVSSQLFRLWLNNLPVLLEEYGVGCQYLDHHLSNVEMEWTDNGGLVYRIVNRRTI
eukprot:Lithocolla_globosa_v1_NODE_896_length_3116_cov_8.460634.p1 type:complete len:802 gc:universal NODE_896_length_3116_cov_8.460634:597-3002(+)